MKFFIDSNIEEQYGEELYQEYLEKENKQMKEDITTMNKEIERLKSRLEEYQEYVKINHKEIERLNNIIKRFDKWLDEESEKTILSTGHLTCLMMCKNKLQELKGSDKE